MGVIARLVVVVTVLLAAFDFSSPESVRWLFALVPQHVFHSPTHRCPLPFLWNLVTCHFFDSSIFRSVVAVPICYVFAMRLEELWGVFTLIQYLGFSLVLSGCCGLACRIGEFALSGNARNFFTPVRGTCGLLTILGVGVAHAFPLMEAQACGCKAPRLLAFRLKSVPALVVGFMTFGMALSPSNFPEAPFAIGGIFFSWLHIRYLMAFPAAGVLGDHSRDWQFNQLLPSIFACPVKVFGNVLKLAISMCGSCLELRDGPTVAPLYSSITPAQRSAQNTQHVNGFAYDARRTMALAYLDQNIADLTGRPRLLEMV
jgi:hypothetical protein